MVLFVDREILLLFNYGFSWRLTIGLSTPKQNFQKVPEEHSWPGTLTPPGLSNSLLLILMTSHSMMLNINFVVNLLASGQYHDVETY